MNYEYACTTAEVASGEMGGFSGGHRPLPPSIKPPGEGWRLYKIEQLKSDKHNVFAWLLLVWEKQKDPFDAKTDT